MPIAGFKLIVLSIEVPLLAAFTLAGMFYFKTSQRDFWVVITQVLGSLTVAANLWSAFTFESENVNIMHLLGVIFLLESMGLFVWTYFSTRKRTLSFAFDQIKSDFLIQEGPYRLIRHPYYVSYTLAWFGGAFATGNTLLFAPCVIMMLLYDRASRLEENFFRQSALASEFEIYSRRTGRFFPILFLPKSGP